MKRAAIDVTAKSTADDRWITCVHEAGHAVVGNHFNAIISYIEVLDKPDICRRRAGCCVYSWEPDEDGRLPFSAAGRLAEHLVDDSEPRRIEAVFLYGLMSERRDVQVSAMRFCGLGPDQEVMMRELCARGLKDPISAFHRVEKATWALVKKLKPEIMAVATALYDRGRLDCEDIDNVLEDLRDAA